MLSSPSTDKDSPPGSLEQHPDTVLRKSLNKSVHQFHTQGLPQVGKCSWYLDKDSPPGNLQQHPDTVPGKSLNKSVH